MSLGVRKQYRLAVVLTFALFALWGIGQRLYETLAPQFAKVFAMNSAQLVLTQSVYPLIYLLLAIPAAVYSRTFGSKATIVFGLGSFAVGAFLFYPAVQEHAYGSFLFAAAIMSAGYLFLEIGANPLVARLGPTETTIRRLNIGHAIFPLGALAATYIGRWVILSNESRPLNQLAGAIVMPYMVIGIGLLLAAFLIDKIEFPAVATERASHREVLHEFRSVLKRPSFLAAMGAMLCVTAARNGTGALGMIYIKSYLPGATTVIAANYMFAMLLTYSVGRWVAALLMFRFDPMRLLALFAASGVVCGMIATLYGGTLGVWAIVGSGFSVSLMFATVLGAAIKDLGPLMKAGTALMYTCSSGAAFGIAIMNLVWAVSSVQYAMIVPTLGYAGVLIFALSRGRASV